MRRNWTFIEIAQLVDLYPHVPTIEIAELMERGISGIYGMANKLALEKSAAFLQGESSGRISKGNVHYLKRGEAFRFVKGGTPANAGLRRPGWGPGRMKETQFKKGMRTGQAAKNWKPIGTILTDHEGYLRIKVRDAVHGEEATGFGNTKVWPLLNRKVWEDNHGPIPPKHIVIFKDRNRANCDIENLDLISKAENARRNGMWNPDNMPRELAEVIQLAGALKRKIRSRDKNATEEQNQ